jgi:hypothetical protein
MDEYADERLLLVFERRPPQREEPLVACYHDGLDQGGCQRALELLAEGKMPLPQRPAGGWRRRLAEWLAGWLAERLGRPGPESDGFGQCAYSGLGRKLDGLLDPRLGWLLALRQPGTDRWRWLAGAGGLDQPARRAIRRAQATLAEEEARKRLDKPEWDAGSPS